MRRGISTLGDGHEMYWEESGNPAGKPALVLHGGPGSGCTPNQRRNFDPFRYRIVLFDQRNCGRSRPQASDENVDLSKNTTQHLVNDIEVLRKHLGIDRWLIWGMSWGSVLALVYAQQHPERVSQLLLMVMGTGRRIESELMTSGFAQLFPEAWSKFDGFSKLSNIGGSVIDRYYQLLFDPNPEVRFQAAEQWCAWEAAVIPTGGPSPRFDLPEYRLAFSRVVTHYWRNGCWLEEGQVLRDAHKLAGVCGHLLQGRLDLSNLSGSPWELAARWPDCTLEFFDSGHEGNLDMIERLIGLTDHYAG